jgi:hypothetical protein
LDLWIKFTANEENQKDILEQLFDHIQRNDGNPNTNKFLKACKKNEFLKKLEQNYEVYWLKKLGTDEALKSVVNRL